MSANAGAGQEAPLRGSFEQRNGINIYISPVYHVSMIL